MKEIRKIESNIVNFHIGEINVRDYNNPTNPFEACQYQSHFVSACDMLVYTLCGGHNIFIVH